MLINLDLSHIPDTVDASFVLISKGFISDRYTHTHIYAVYKISKYDR